MSHAQGLAGLLRCNEFLLTAVHVSEGDQGTVRTIIDESGSGHYSWDKFTVVMMSGRVFTYAGKKNPDPTEAYITVSCEYPQPISHVEGILPTTIKISSGGRMGDPAHVNATNQSGCEPTLDLVITVVWAEELNQFIVAGAERAAAEAAAVGERQ